MAALPPYGCGVPLAGASLDSGSGWETKISGIEPLAKRRRQAEPISFFWRLTVLLAGNDVILCLKDAVCRDSAPDGGGGIDAGVPADDRAGGKLGTEKGQEILNPLQLKGFQNIQIEAT